MYLALLAFALASTDAFALVTKLQKAPGRHGVERTAVCISGELRTHYLSRIQQDLKNNFHREGYEYFYSSDVAVDASKTVLNPIRASITANARTEYLFSKDVDANPENLIKQTFESEHLISCPAGTFSAGSEGGKRTAMASRYVDCYNAMLQEEKAKGFKYDYVMRIRPDHFFAKEFPSPKDLLNRSGGKEVVSFDDHISVGTRKYGDVVLYFPWKASEDCHTMADCQRVCQDKVCLNNNCFGSGQWLNLATKYAKTMPSHRVYKFWDGSVLEQKSVGLIWELGHKQCGDEKFESKRKWFKREGDVCFLNYFR